MAFVAAGFDLAGFWSLTPRTYALMMRGARDRDRSQRLLLAEAVRAGTRLDAEDFEKWVAAVSGHDTRLPPEVLGRVMQSAGQSIEQITMREALERMH